MLEIRVAVAGLITRSSAAHRDVELGLECTKRSAERFSPAAVGLKDLFFEGFVLLSLRQRNVEPRAVAHAFTFRPCSTPMKLGQLLHQRQSDACPLILSSRRRIDLRKSVEDSRQLLRRDSDP